MVGLAIGLILGGIIGFLYSNTTEREQSFPSALEADQVRVTAEAYINQNMLNPGTSASIESITEKSGLYELEIRLTGGAESQVVTTYVSNDGKLFFPDVIDMTGPIPTSPPTTQPSSTEGGIDMKALAGDDPSRGPADAPVTIIEYGDFSCGPTAQALHTVEKVLENYPTQVRFVYKNLQTMGGWSTKGMVAAECAYSQDTDAFWNFHDNLFHGRMQGTVTTANIDSQVLKWAEEMELDTGAFKSCYENQEPAQEIAGDIAEARSLGISGTPTFIINGRMISGGQPYEAFWQIIETELGRDVGDITAQIPPDQGTGGTCETQ